MSDYIRGLRRLSKAPDGVVQIKPIVIGESDRRAAKLLAYIVEELLPDDATIGDTEDVLLAALWWLHAWSSNDKAEKLRDDNAPDAAGEE